MPTITNHLYPTIHQLSEFCHVGEIHIDKQDSIQLVSLSHIKRQDVDAWIAHSEAIRQSWLPTKPLLILIDMSEADFAFTPYITRKGNELMKIQGGIITTYIGWIIKPSPMASMFKSVLEMRNGLNNNHYHIVHNREDAYAWLVAQRDAFYQQQQA